MTPNDIQRAAKLLDQAAQLLKAIQFLRSNNHSDYDIVFMEKGRDRDGMQPRELVVDCINRTQQINWLEARREDFLKQAGDIGVDIKTLTR